MRELSQIEARVLGVLVEKQHTVPDSYPLSLNALTIGCNQKTARQPLMELTDSDVLSAIESLKSLHLIVEVSGSRVLRYEHNAARALGLPSQSVALLAVLALRGPQTAAELRQNCDRLHHFADVSSVEAFLDELAAKDPPRVARLARSPGERESRWVHGLCGELPAHAAEPMRPAAAGEPLRAVPADELAQLRAEQARLAAEVERLGALVNRMASELGLPVEGGEPRAI